MRTGRIRIVSLVTAFTAVAVYSPPQAPAAADPNPPVETFTWSPNMEPLGGSLRATDGIDGTPHTDLAFWAGRLYQGNYAGFRIIDISNPEDPQELINYTACSGSFASLQGDMVVWNNILVRSWNLANESTTETCDGEVVAPGFQGLHIFDVSNPADPDLVASVNLPGCGSHTATGAPDFANNRLIVYNGAASEGCPIQIVEIPFNNPAAAELNPVPLPAGRMCHDNSVILGSAMLLACAGNTGFTVFSLGGSRPGTMTAPAPLYTVNVEGVTVGHSHAFSWDGEILVFGHEPGGGGQARCQPSSATVDKTLFFFEADTGTELGRWVLPRPQSSVENCTVHNFNVVPHDRRNILVSGNYQAGIAVVDFTDPTNPVEIAFADPAPLSPPRGGGDWSTYWYDGIIYESDITRGLITWRLNDPAVLGARMLGHSNPQTQEFTIPFVSERAEVSITKSDSRDPTPTGRQLTYTVNVMNHGPNAGSAVQLRDTLPGSVEFVSATPSQGTCEHASGIVICELGTIDSAAAATVQIVVVPRTPGTLVNSATVTAATFDPFRANNSVSELTSVCRSTSRRQSIPCG